MATSKKRSTRKLKKRRATVTIAGTSQSQFAGYATDAETADSADPGRKPAPAPGDDSDVDDDVDDSGKEQT